MGEVPIDWDALREHAERARENAHAPYSGFRVGAALMTEEGHLFGGANVENASYGLTICAERVAVGAAVAQGARRFRALAIVTTGPAPAPPCGACRQVLAEFPPSFVVRTYGGKDDYLERTVDELLPDAFRLEP